LGDALGQARPRLPGFYFPGTISRTRRSLAFNFASRKAAPRGNAVITQRAAIVTAILGVGLSGCGSVMDSFAPAASAPPIAAVAPIAPAYSVDKLIGNWGVASYRVDKDKARTEGQARAQCKLPYVIVKGPTDGVMMHVADDTTIHELTLKGGPNGKTYLGFAGPPGDDQDREVLSMSDTMFVVRYINEDINSRYGTFIYVRCKAARG
jgi:uncharacterized protein YceK